MPQSNQHTEEALRLMAKEELHSLFYRLGYDLSVPEEMRKLEKDLEWVNRKRDREHAHSVNVSKAIWLIITAALGSVGTAIVEWYRPH
jgi:hypothetical protein